MSAFTEADEETPLQSKKSPPLGSLESFSEGDSSNPSEYLESVFEHDDEINKNAFYQRLKPRERNEMIMADRLSIRLLAAHDDSLIEDQILEETLQMRHPSAPRFGTYLGGASVRSTGRFRSMLDSALEEQKQAKRKLQWMGATVLLLVVGLTAAVGYGAVAVIEAPPPFQPVGRYRLIERQEGTSLFEAYSFYVGKDSVGSNGFNYYVDRDTAEKLEIVNITMERDQLDLFYQSSIRDGRRRTQDLTVNQSKGEIKGDLDRAKANHTWGKNGTENVERPFVYIGSAASEDGPRSSIRLEGNRRFDRGLFILDVRRMPAGCGVWPAFWLVDELNWPVNGTCSDIPWSRRCLQILPVVVLMIGSSFVFDLTTGEIDIVEGVNYQTVAKTALHSTIGCKMDDIPLGTMTGTWDTAQGIPDKKTGIPDMTLRYAENCFVYDSHQWLNQGCVAMDEEGGTIGVPLNEKGGGVYVLEWYVALLRPTKKHGRKT